MPGEGLVGPDAVGVAVAGAALAGDGQASEAEGHGQRDGIDPEQRPMATRGGAKCLGRDDIGSLEPGKAADLIAIDTRRLSYAGAGSDILAAIVFSPWPEPVDLAMVNGTLVVEGGELRGVDVPALVSRADEIALTLGHEAAIAAFEGKRDVESPWLVPGTGA